MRLLLKGGYHEEKSTLKVFERGYLTRAVNDGMWMVFQKKAFLYSVWKRVWNRKNLCHEQLPTTSCRSNALLANGYEHPQNDHTPNFFPDSKSFILGLSNDASYVSEFLRSCGQYSLIFFWKLSVIS